MNCYKQPTVVTSLMNPLMVYNATGISNLTFCNSTATCENDQREFEFCVQGVDAPSQLNGFLFTFKRTGIDCTQPDPNLNLQISACKSGSVDCATHGGGTAVACTISGAGTCDPGSENCTVPFPIEQNIGITFNNDFFPCNETLS